MRVCMQDRHRCARVSYRRLVEEDLQLQIRQVSHEQVRHDMNQQQCEIVEKVVVVKKSMTVDELLCCAKVENGKM